MAANENDAALEEAVAVLQGGVQRPDMEATLRVIETWEQRLAASESTELVPIADNQAALRIQLLAGDFDPAAVGQLLWLRWASRFGRSPRATSGRRRRPASRLGELLSDRGNALAGR